MTFQKKLVIFGIPLLLIGILVFIAKSSIYSIYPSKLGAAITFDSLLTVPLVYFLLIRKTKISKSTVLPFVILGMVICLLVLPSENQYYLGLFKTWILPVVEFSVLIFVGYNIFKTIKKYKRTKHKSIDFFTTLKKVCSEILPKIAVTPVVTEIAVFYYGFINWKRRQLKKNEFSYHKNSGTISLLVALIFIIGIETVVFHILLAKWNNIAAWVLTSLSIYSAIQLFGFLKSMLKRPIIIENNRLHLRYGIMVESVIDLNTIDSVELFSKDIKLNKETRKLSFLGDLESHNVLIKLKQEHTLIGLYGIKRKFKNLVFCIDDKTSFINQIKSKLNEY